MKQSKLMQFTVIAGICAVICGTMIYRSFPLEENVSSVLKMINGIVSASFMLVYIPIIIFLFKMAYLPVDKKPFLYLYKLIGFPLLFPLVLLLALASILDVFDPPISYLELESMYYNLWVVTSWPYWVGVFIVEMVMLIIVIFKQRVPAANEL